MEIITYNNQTPATFTSNLFSDFVAYIDRGEKTTRSYLSNLKQFAAWMKYAGINQPERADIVNYKAWLASEHEAIAFDPESGWRIRTDSTGEPLRIICKANTIAQYLRSVCQFFRWTAANGLYSNIAENIHAPKVRNTEHKKDALNVQEVLSIEEHIKESARSRKEAAATSYKDADGKLERSTEQGKRMLAMYMLTVNAGLRTIELSRANVRDLQTRDGQSWLYIWGKGHAEADQKKPIAREVAEALKDYLQSRKDKPTGNSPLFVATGNRSGGKRLAPTTISTMLKSAMKEAGFDSERLTAHSLRHTTGTAVQELTGNLYTTQQYMRHSNPATTEIYLHNETEKQEACIAQDLYNLYHGSEKQSGKEQLERIIARLNPQQIEQLAGIAAAMA